MIFDKGVKSINSARKGNLISEGLNIDCAPESPRGALKMLPGSHLQKFCSIDLVCHLGIEIF